jgi:hypothetical protein
MGAAGAEAMSSKKGNGHDSVTAEMVAVLREIREGIKETNERIDALRTETTARLDAIKTITEAAHRHIHERIDEAQDEAIRNTQRLTHVPEGVLARLERLETAVFKKTGT